MRKKGGGSEENTFDPTALPEEDAAKRTGRADGGSEFPKVRQVAELAIKDIKDGCANYETEEDKENG